MAKDKTGKYHPPKGKPSGINKSEGLGAGSTDPDKMDQYNEITEKYTTDNEEIAPSVRTGHPNRNVSKGEESSKLRDNTDGK